LHHFVTDACYMITADALAEIVCRVLLLAGSLKHAWKTGRWCRPHGEVVLRVHFLQCRHGSCPAGMSPVAPRG
jgi:hypothetical protein